MKDPWFPVACVLVVVLVAWLPIVGPLPPTLANWIYQWQTIIAAVTASTIASTAAYIAFRNTSRTIAHTEKLERNRRRRKLASVRALLPLALSSLTDFAQRSAEKLDVLAQQCKGAVLPRGTARNDLVIDPPSDALAGLAEFIEYSDDLDLSVLEHTVALVQVHNARVRGIIRDNQNIGPTMSSVHQRTIETSMIDAASIYAGVAAYYDYARRAADAPPHLVTWDMVKSALNNMRFWDHSHASLHKHADDRAKSTAGPFRRFGKRLIIPNL